MMLNNGQCLQTVLMNNWLRTQTLSLLVAGWIKDEFRGKQTKLALPDEDDEQ